MKKCYECGSAVELFTAPYLYNECGLPNVVLLGIDQYRCKGCSEEFVTIPKPTELNDRLAETLLKKKEITHGEFRFLRVYAGWSGRELARILDVTAETLSRWERGKRPIPLLAIISLKTFVVCGTQIQDYILHDAIERHNAPPMPFEEFPALRYNESGWVSEPKGDSLPC